MPFLTYSMEENKMSEDFSKLTKKQLLDKLAEKSVPEQSGTISVNEHESELEKIDQLAVTANPHQIPFTVKNDHKNVMLYTAINKRVGPLHPDNARRTMIRWKKAGIQLYTSPRTPDQIEEFKKTPDYIKSRTKHDALRKLRQSQSSKGKTEKMMKDIAKITANAVAGAK